MDYSFESGKCELAYTVELDPQTPKPSLKGFKLSESKIKKVFERNIVAALCLIDNVVNKGKASQGRIESGPKGNKINQPSCCSFGKWKITGNQPPS